MDALQKDRDIPYSNGCKVHTGWRNGSVMAHVTKDGKKISKEIAFATESMAMDYWNDKYHHGGLTTA